MTLSVIAGKYKGRKLRTVSSLSTRPSSSLCRGALFNICQNSIAGAVFLDLYAGSGAVGLEALSRGAEFVYFIEKDKKALECIYNNVMLLDVAIFTKIIAGEVQQNLKKIKRSCDIVFIDPPYVFYERTNFVPSLLEELLVCKIITEGTRVFFEMPFKIQNELLFFEKLENIELVEKRKYSSSMLVELMVSKKS